MSNPGNRIKRLTALAGGDLAFSWQPDDQWKVSARVEDLLARIRWQDAPYTEAVASTDQKSFDENGYAEFAPLLSGREGYRSSFMQDLDARYYGSVEYRRNDWLVSARGQYQFGYGYFGLGVGRRFDNDVNVTGLWWPEYEQFGIEASRGKWAGYVVVDQIKWEKVQALTMGISYGY